jgi:hypothetical protein
MRRLRDTLILVATMAVVMTPAVVVGLATGAAVLATPEAAQASPQSVIVDCAKDGKLDHHYSLSDLKQAEKQLPSDVDEYTNCREVINQAEVASSGSGNKGSSHVAVSGAGGGGGGAGGASNADAQALAKATKRASGNAPTLSLGGHEVSPGSPGAFKSASAATTLPAPVLAVLIAVGLLTATGGMLALRRRFPEVVGAALRIFRR